MDPGQVSQVIDVAIKWEHADSTVLFTDLVKGLGKTTLQDNPAHSIFFGVYSN